MQVAEVHKFQRFRKWVIFSNRANPITNKKKIHNMIHNLFLLHLWVLVDFLPTLFNAQTTEL